ncbi:ATP-dependent DNA helicase [Elysia marginata]|uniref:ATP-dependent DNA helicase n=1 Tax=Elysia marginata TaxID=1093978 RepID=A0AAV4I5C9_9GAST|nr:ATP-dependent DNA helicase [Elysia marginata]
MPDTPQRSDKSHHNQRPEYASCKVTYLNAQSVGNKTVTINNMITDKKPDLVFITETWLAENGDDVTLYELTLTTHTIISHPRKNRPGGGICVIINKNLNFKAENITSFSSFECTKLTTMNKTSICLYHPPPSATNPSHRQFIADLECLIEHHSEVLDHVIILGDFNIHFDSLTDTYSKHVKTLLHNNDLTNLQTTATIVKDIFLTGWWLQIPLLLQLMTFVSQTITSSTSELRYIWGKGKRKLPQTETLTLLMWRYKTQI